MCHLGMLQGKDLRVARVSSVTSFGRNWCINPVVLSDDADRWIDVHSMRSGRGGP